MKYQTLKDIIFSPQLCFNKLAFSVIRSAVQRKRERESDGVSLNKMDLIVVSVVQHPIPLATKLSLVSSPSLYQLQTSVLRTNENWKV